MRRRPNKRLMKCRKVCHWSIEEVAGKVGISVSAMQSIENGVIPSREIQEKLCSLFEVSVQSTFNSGHQYAFRRAEFIRKKQENASLTDNLTEAGRSSETIMNIGYIRRVRRG